MTETQEKTYGIFKKTREERGLSLSDVANALHLTVTMIEQIEAGEFKHRHLAPVFMRGYIRSYAKFLNLPENLVDKMISPLSIENPVKNIEKSKPNYVKQDKKHQAKQPIIHNPKKVLFYLLVVALLIIIASFWHGTSKTETLPETAKVVATPENTLSEPESIPSDENMVTTESEENTPLSSEEAPPSAPEDESILETTPTPPAIETPPSAPPVIVAPPPVKKAPVPPKVTMPAPTPTTPTSPEVVDAQETV